MLTINDLKSKMIVMIDEAPYQVLEVKHLHMGRGGSSVQTRVKNLLTGQVYSRNFKPADTFAAADIEKRDLVFLYHHRDEYVFHAKENAGERIILREAQMGEAAPWLKAGVTVTAMFLNGRIVAVTAPIKVDLRVTEAPPTLRGDTVSGATKTVTVESGAKVQTPLFIGEGDTIRINTETGEYAERVTKTSG